MNCHVHFITVKLIETLNTMNFSILGSIQIVNDSVFSDADATLEVMLMMHNPILRSITIFGTLTGLQKLQIAFNPSLTHLNLTLPQNSSLEQLLLDNNAFTVVDTNWFKNHPLLKEVSLANNSLSEFKYSM